MTTPVDALDRAHDLLVRQLPHPFSVERRDKHVSAGETVFEIMRQIGCKPGRAYLVMLNGECVFPEQWKTVRPAPGDDLIVRAVPMGGNSGDSNKTLRTVLQVIVVVVALIIIVYSGGTLTGPVFAAGASTWGLVAAAAVTIVGDLRAVALLPPRAAR